VPVLSEHESTGISMSDSSQLAAASVEKFKDRANASVDKFNERTSLSNESGKIEVRTSPVPAGEPRIIALLSWFDEPDAVLGQCLAGLQYAGVDHVVAVDGRYALFPGEDAVSPAAQQGLIALACRTLGMGCSLHLPTGAWSGEVEKRNFLFDQGLAVAEPGDWFLVVDADIVITCIPW
jgi:hypothetical protein